MKNSFLILKHIIIVVIITIISITSCNVGKQHTKNKSPIFGNNNNNNIDSGSTLSYTTSSTSNTGYNPIVVESSPINIEPDKISNGEEYYYIPLKGVKARVIDNTKIIKENSFLSEGRIVYKIPDKMKVRSTYKVLVRISKSKKTISVYENLSGDVVTSTLPVTETMDVKLIDVSPEDRKEFNIIKANNSEQIIEDGDTYTEWSWDVTPIRVGSSKLKIIISVIRDKGKKDIVYEDTVIVEKDILVQVIFFFESYWQLLLTSIAIPFIVFLYKRRKEKEKKRRR